MLATLEVEAVQRLNQRARDDKTYHFLFSFREGEIPIPEVLLDCEREFCAALGFAEHQRVSVVHHDTNNLHVHVAVNKIHPTRLTIHTPLRDYWIRTETAKRLELKHQLRRDRHERRDPDEHPTGRAADMERHTGLESFAGWIQRHAAAELCRASSWAELHRAAAMHGLQIRVRGNGCILTDGLRTVRASSVRRELSFSALQKKLGAFEPLQKTPGRELGRAALPKVGPTTAHTFATPPAVRAKHQHLGALLDHPSAVVTRSEVAPTTQAVAAREESRSDATADMRPPITREEQQRRLDGWAELLEQLLRVEQAKRARGGSPSATRNSWAAATEKEHYRAQPLPGHEETSKLYRHFLRERAAREMMRRARSVELRRDQRADFDRVIRRWRFRRAALRLVPGTRAEKRFLHAAARLAMQQELKALKRRAVDARSGLARETKRLVWADWLQDRARAGDATALAALRARNAAPTSDQVRDIQPAIAGVPSSGPMAAARGAIDTVTKTGVVIYRGALAGIRDDGGRLRVQGRVSQNVLAAALRLAANRYGSALRVEGDDAFKQAVLNVAVARNIDVTFDDATHEARRRLSTENENEREIRTQPRPRQDAGATHVETPAERTTAGRRDRVRDVRLGELVRDGARPELLLPRHVPSDLAGGDGEGRQDLRRAADAAGGVTRGGAPPFRRGRLLPLTTLSASTSAASPSRRSMPSSPAKHRPSKVVALPRPIAVRATSAALGAGVAMHESTGAATAIARYVAEREEKRTRGMSGILPHSSFDGPGDFTFVGRRNVAGQPLLLLRDSTRIVVLPAHAEAAELRSGELVTLGADGRIVLHSHNRSRS